MKRLNIFKIYFYFLSRYKIKMKNKILVLFIIFLIIIFIVKLNVKKNKIIFMTAEETRSFFVKDEDHYLEFLSDYDIMSLKSESKSDYLEKSLLDALDFDDYQKARLTEACEDSDKFLKSIYIPHINTKKMAEMDWKLSLTTGETYEDGYPHTRMDIIFITPKVINMRYRNLVRTMIHEKVHVYERLYPYDMERWLRYSGFKRYKRFKEYSLRRSNPDLDGWVYLDPEGNETLAVFRNRNPTGIDDANYPGGRNYMMEHPNETLAYYIDFKYANEKFPYQLEYLK